MKKLSVFAFLIGLVFLFSHTIFAQTETPTPTPTSAPNNSSQVQDLQNTINDLQAKITNLKGQEQTLSSQIAVFDSQIRITELRITQTKQQLSQLTSDIDTASKKIVNLDKSLQNLSKVLLNRIVETYEVGSVHPMQVLLSSGTVSDVFRQANYLKIVQAHDRELIYSTQQAKNDYANQKNIFEDEKKKAEALQAQLETYNTQLDSQKASKQQLLTETAGSESNYQRLLAQAQAQLAGFSNFTAAHGGASLLSGQTVCDDWGCYYNQRDTQWGGTALNHTQYTVASDGCLMTSMAMVYTHYGHRGVTPASINSDPNNFASYYPAYLKYTISADGATSNRVGASIDSTLASGDPVIVGISYDGGPVPDHFVVLVSGSSGNYIMNDPFTAGGHKIPFTDHYSVGSIREIDKVVF